MMLALGLVPGIQAKNSGHGKGHDKGDHGNSGNAHEKDEGEGEKGRQKADRDDNERESHEKNHEGRKGENGRQKADRDDDERESHGKNLDGRKGESGHRITSVEQRTFHDYVVGYQQNGKFKTLPPGLAKKVARGGELPPGWQMKIARGEVLPLAVYQQVNPIPYVLIERLPVQPVGTHLGVIDGRVVRLADATRTILDVFDLR